MTNIWRFTILLEFCYVFHNKKVFLKKIRLPTAILKHFPNITICDMAEDIAMSSFACIVIWVLLKSYPNKDFKLEMMVRLC